MLRQLVRDQVGVGELVDLAHAVHEHDLVEALVGVGVADDAHERRQAGAGREQVEVAAGQQVGQHQRAGRLAADQHLVADLQVLQPRGQRAVRDLDAEELEVLFPVGAGDRIGAHQRLAVDHRGRPSRSGRSRSAGSAPRVQVNVNSDSFQWWTESTFSTSYAAIRSFSASSIQGRAAGAHTAAITTRRISTSHASHSLGRIRSVPRKLDSVYRLER